MVRGAGTCLPDALNMTIFRIPFPFFCAISEHRKGVFYAPAPERALLQEEGSVDVVSKKAAFEEVSVASPRANEALMRRSSVRGAFMFTIYSNYALIMLSGSLRRAQTHTNTFNDSLRRALCTEYHLATREKCCFSHLAEISARLELC